MAGFEAAGGWVRGCWWIGRAGLEATDECDKRS